MNITVVVYRILLLIAYAVEPIIWILILSSFFKRKYKSRIYYFLAGTGAFLLIAFKQMLAFKKSGIEMLVLILLIVYYILTFRKIFICKTQKLLFCLSTLFIIALLTETIAIGLLLLICNYNIPDMAKLGKEHIIMTLLSKIILIIGAYIFLRYRKRGKLKRQIHVELGPILFGCVLWEIPNVALFNNMRWIGNSILLFFWLVLGQVILVILIIYMKKLIDKHSRLEMEYQIRIERAKIEIELTKSLNYTAEELYKLKHDLNKQICVLKNLYNENNYEELGRSINNMVTGLEHVEKYYTISNTSVSALLNQKRMEAIGKNIEFDAELMIDDFVMNDIEICLILGNILDNAIEANEFVVKDQRFINIKIIQEREGFNIECVNSLSVIPKCDRNEYKTTKADSKGHGLGINIIRNIVKSHNGVVKFDNTNSTFTVTIYVPYE